MLIQCTTFVRGVTMWGLCRKDHRRVIEQFQFGFETCRISSCGSTPQHFTRAKLELHSLECSENEVRSLDALLCVRNKFAVLKCAVCGANLSLRAWDTNTEPSMFVCAAAANLCSVCFCASDATASDRVTLSLSLCVPVYAHRGWQLRLAVVRIIAMTTATDTMTLFRMHVRRRQRRRRQFLMCGTHGLRYATCDKCAYVLIESVDIVSIPLCSNASVDCNDVFVLISQ